MTSFTEIEPALPVLARLFAAATEKASAAMRRWTCGQVDLVLESVRECALEEAAGAVDVGDELLTMVVLGVTGAQGGQMILTFDEANGRRLAAGLLNRAFDSSAPWSPLEQSAVMETGNIMASAYLSELSRLIGRELAPTPPSFLQDFGGSVLEQAIMCQAMESDRALICRTRFELNQQAVDWSLFFLPSSDLLHVMHQAVFAA